MFGSNGALGRAKQEQQRAHLNDLRSDGASFVILVLFFEGLHPFLQGAMRGLHQAVHGM
jgi:hypothetical protein